MSEGEPEPSAFYERYWFGKPDGKLDDFTRKWPVLRHLIPRESGVVMLDYGCGDGEIIKELRAINAGARYIGVDISKTALAKAQASLPDAVFYQVGDGERVPIPAASVDFIFCSEVIEHLFDVQGFINEMHRVLVPGGQLVLTTPYHGWLKNLAVITFNFDRHFDPTRGHVRFFSRASLTRCLQAGGFRVDRVSGIGRRWPLWKSMFVVARKSG